MPNVYSGTILSDTGSPLKDVEVKTRYTNSSGQSTLATIKTGNDGTWRISIPDGINSSTVTITFVRTGFSSFTIKNPKPTENFTFPTSQIDQYRGGTLNFNAGFESGKYLVSSLDSYDQGLLDYELANVMKFFNNYKDTPYASIKIDASESQIGNYDREPSASNGTANSKFGASLGQKALSDYRANNLETYIKQYFKDNGQPAPDIQKNSFVSGLPAPSPFPERDTPAYKKVLEDYKEYQFVKIRAILTGPPCIDIPFTGSQGSNVTFIKPPGAKTITIDALQFPDRFGFSPNNNVASVVYTDTFYQNPNALGSLLSWSFILSLQSITNPQSIQGLPTKDRFPIILGEELKKNLTDDWFVRHTGDYIPIIDKEKGGDVARQIISWNQAFADSADATTRSIVFGYKAYESDKHIDFIFNNIPGTINIGIEGNERAFVRAVYGYPIKRAPLPFDLTGVNDNGSFIIAYFKGNFSGPSLWKYKMCPT